MPTTEHKLLAAVAHLSFLIGMPIVLPLVIYIWKREESPFVADHAKQALGMHVLCTMTMLAMFVMFVGSMYSRMWLGAAIMMAMVGFQIVALVWTVIATMRVADGTAYRYPLVGRVFARF